MRFSRWIGWAAVLAAAAACSPASDQPPALGDCSGGADAACGTVMPPSPGSSTNQCGNVSPNDPSCNACLVRDCCTQIIACNQDRNCAALSSCVDGCASDATCADRCTLLFAAGVTAFQNVDACRGRTCSGACGVGAVADAGADVVGGVEAGGACTGFVSTFTAPTPACQSCVFASCCAEGTACGASAACVAVASCAQTCATNDNVCRQACLTTNPDGAVLYGAITMCMTASCPLQCGVHTDAG